MSWYFNFYLSPWRERGYSSEYFPQSRCPQYLSPPEDDLKPVSTIFWRILHNYWDIFTFKTQLYLKNKQSKPPLISSLSNDVMSSGSFAWKTYHSCNVTMWHERLFSILLNDSKGRGRPYDEKNRVAAHIYIYMLCQFKTHSHQKIVLNRCNKHLLPLVRRMSRVYMVLISAVRIILLLWK